MSVARQMVSGSVDSGDDSSPNRHCRLIDSLPLSLLEADFEHPIDGQWPISLLGCWARSSGIASWCLFIPQVIK